MALVPTPVNRKFSKKSTKSNAEALYTRIVRQSRNPVFFEKYGVADTIDGRFDMIVLHVFLVLRRFKIEGKPAETLGQSVFDTMFMNMDSSLREMGVGDLSVGKRIKKMAAAFYGRVDAYEQPLIDGDRVALSAAVARNLFRGEAVKEGVTEAISDYMLATWSHLSDQPLERFHLGLVDFGDAV